MTRRTSRRWRGVTLLVAVLAMVATIGMAPAQAEAGWWCGSCCGWTPVAVYPRYCGCCVRTCCDPCWTSCRCSSCWTSYGYCWNNWRTYGCQARPVCPPRIAGCCGTTTSGTVIEAAPSENSPTPAPPEPAVAPSDASTGVTPEMSGLLAIQVPEDATVTINGYQTKSTGAYREYVSRDLKPGYTYAFEVRATIVRDGETLEEVQSIKLIGGGQQDLAFGFYQASNEALAAR